MFHVEHICNDPVFFIIRVLYLVCTDTGCSFCIAFLCISILLITQIRVWPDILYIVLHSLYCPVSDLWGVNTTPGSPPLYCIVFAVQICFLIILYLSPRKYTEFFWYVKIYFRVFNWKILHDIYIFRPGIRSLCRIPEKPSGYVLYRNSVSGVYLIFYPDIGVHTGYIETRISGIS